ncbi:MAG: class II fructose-bisphosphate aldolase family protein [Nanoarchaeota archaeon]|nr:class II fructose-bisphosphate aldolase family protein [Nanoarchaeota archaeon]
MLVTNRKLQEDAQKRRYAVGAFNVYDMESVQAVAKAAELERSPAIIATTEGAIEYAGHEFIAELIELATKRSKITYSMHLDHGKDMNIIRNCIRLGYTSVMIDASHYEFKKNIQITKSVVSLAHRKGASVEAELGTIGGVEDSVSSKKILLTDPRDAKEFVEKTGCDTLAVAIGTSHGAYKFASRSKLAIDRLKEIRKAVDVPLVLHGASGIPSWVVRKAKLFGAVLGKAKGVSESDIKAAIANGISKVNIDSDLRLTFDAAVREVLKKHPEEFDPRHILGPAKDAVTDMVRYKMKLFGSSGKAR